MEQNKCFKIKTVVYFLGCKKLCGVGIIISLFWAQRCADFDNTQFNAFGLQ